MIALSVHAAKGGFFDRRKVIDAMDKTARRVLSKFGAFVRTRARSSIRKRKKVSEPGNPPSSHTGMLKRFLFFAWDFERKSVVIGPAKTNQASANRSGGPGIPEILEKGGRLGILERFRHGRWERVNVRSRAGEQNLQTRIRTVTIAPRPYMRPAFELESPRLLSFWKDSLRAA